VGVSRELSPRRDGARQLQLQPQDVPLLKEAAPIGGDVVRTRGDEARKGGARRPVAVVAKQQQQPAPAAIQRKEAALGTIQRYHC
jgi:hypothetical protein